MPHVNGWLMSLAFVLGLLLTLAMMIRRVTREVPVSRTATVKADSGSAKVAKVAGAAVATGAAAKLHGAADKVERVEKKVETKLEKKAEKVETKLEKKAEKVEAVLEKEPYGAGSIRVSARTAAPAGYTVKGDKDTGRYFTLDSPEYQAIEAEVWFANEESARKAGFLRWDAKADLKTELAEADSAAVITEHHLPADIIIREVHSEADASIVVVDNGPASGGAAPRDNDAK